MSGKARLKVLIEKMLDNILSEVVSPGYFTTIRFHTSKRLGKDLIDVIVDTPREAYNAIVSIFGEPFIEMVDNILKEYTYEKLRLVTISSNGFLSRLRDGDPSAIVSLARRYEEFQQVRYDN